MAEDNKDDDAAKHERDVREWLEREAEKHKSETEKDIPFFSIPEPRESPGWPRRTGRVAPSDPFDAPGRIHPFEEPPARHDASSDPFDAPERINREALEDPYTNRPSREQQMEERVKALEDKVGQMREDIASIKSTLAQVATKSDLHELKAAIEARMSDLSLKLIMWAVATLIAATAASSAIVFNIVRQAGPPTINITVPPQVSAPKQP